MSISSTANRMPAYTGNGSTANFAFTFKIFLATELLVVKRQTSTGAETVLAYTTDYTVAGAGSASGGSITLVAGNLPTGYTLHIRRLLQITQGTRFRDQASFHADSHEDRFDKQTMIDQQQQDELDRSFKIPESVTPVQFDPKLPTSIVGASNKVPTINAGGNGWADAASWPTSGDISTAVSSAASASSSATIAANHSTTASRWAKQTHGVTVVDVVTGVDSGEYSAKHYAQDAQTAATAASTAKTGAETAQAAAEVAKAAAEAAAASVIGGVNVSGTYASPLNITAAGGITVPNAIKNLMFVQGNGAPVTVIANPRISAGAQIGYEVMLIGRSDTNTLTLQHGNGLSLNGDWVGGDDSTLTLVWVGSFWLEKNRS